MSKKEVPVAYVKHPITPEQKNALRAEGVRIVDAKFAPEGAEIVDLGGGDDADDEPKIPESAADIDKLKKDDLVELLKANGVENPTGNVPDMKADLKKIMFTSL